MIQSYLNHAIKRAAYKKLDDEKWFAQIPGFEGVWANAETIEECRHELMEVLEEWLLITTNPNRYSMGFK